MSEFNSATRISVSGFAMRIKYHIRFLIIYAEC